jgi:hypothetical protein
LAKYEHLPIYKAAFDLLVYFEKIVGKFSRYNKYTHGAALRDITRDVVMLIVRANNSLDKLPVLEEIRIKLEELKVVIRICKEVQAFPNFNSLRKNTPRTWPKARPINTPSTSSGLHIIGGNSQCR